MNQAASRNAQASDSRMPLRVDIVSDVVCPWCIIGYKQLQLALEEFANEFDISIVWHPFELNPDMPVAGQELGEHLAQKYGTSPAQSQSARARLISIGESVGFQFDYYDGMKIYNTFKAHQLLHWAGIEGQQTELKLALFDAFFRRRENIGDSSLLAEVAGRVGLDPVVARELLSSERYTVDVRTEQTRWRERDVHAVPVFYFNNGYPVPGAQEARTFARVLDKLKVRLARTEEENN